MNNSANRPLYWSIFAILFCISSTGVSQAQDNIFPQTGNVGIGTPGPTEKLHVEGGNVRIRQFPTNDTTPSLTGVHLATRGTAGVDAQWSLYAAAVGGGFGVAPNAFEIWEYPARQSRFQIRPGGTTVLAPGTGNVGIGTPGPTEKLHVEGGNVRIRQFPTNDTTPSLTGVHLATRGTAGVDAQWSLYAAAVGGGFGVAPNAFEIWEYPARQSRFQIRPGGTTVLAPGTGNVGIGIASPQTKLDVAGITRTRILVITGGNDLAEPFNVGTTQAIKPGMLVSIDPKQSGQLRLANQAYDRTVAGVISGGNGLSAGLTMGQYGGAALPVALTGRVYAFADASNGPIEPGDLLTTSDTAGHAMKVTNYERAQGAIIGKAMSELENGRGFVLVLVALQ